MTLQVYGPRAQQFVDLLAQFTGLTLVLNGETVTVSPDTLLNPSASETLSDLVFDVVASPNVVRIAAFSMAPGGGFFGDWFYANPDLHRPRRSVFVGDLERANQLSPTCARGLMGHILREYFGAARPPGQQPGLAYSLYHVPAIHTEAEIVSDLTGRPIWTGSSRPWEHTYGNINVRSYGPGLKFQLVISGGNLARIIEPAGL